MKQCSYTKLVGEESSLILKRGGKKKKRKRVFIVEGRMWSRGN